MKTEKLNILATVTTLKTSGCGKVMYFRESVSIARKRNSWLVGTILALVLAMGPGWW